MLQQLFARSDKNMCTKMFRRLGCYDILQLMGFTVKQPRQIKRFVGQGKNDVKHSISRVLMCWVSEKQDMHLFNVNNCGMWSSTRYLLLQYGSLSHTGLYRFTNLFATHKQPPSQLAMVVRVDMISFPR